MLTSVKFGIPSPGFEGGFSPWEDQELINMSSLFQLPQSPAFNYSDNNNSGSDLEPNNHIVVSSSTTTTTDHVEELVLDERKERRMKSNRESARRSRMRKQRHLEDLKNQLNRLKIENRELANRLGLTTQYSHLLRRDNDRLRSESSFLRQRLSDIRQILIFRQLQSLSSSLPCNTVT